MKSLHTISRFHIFKNRKQILKNPLSFHRENFEIHGDSFRIKLGQKHPVIFTRDPGLIKHVLQKQHKKYQKSPIQTVDLAKYIGHGILTSNGDHWRTHRRMVQPAFHKEKLKNLMGTIREAIQSELQRIVPNKTYDIFPLMRDLAFQVVAKSLFSSVNIRPQMEQLQSITETNQQMLVKEMRQPYLKWWFHLNGSIKKHLNLTKDAQNLLHEIIEERRNSKQEKDDLLDMLLQARYEDGSPMPQKQLIDEVMILFTAGHETTSNALSFMLLLLAKHPSIQEKIYQELTNINEHDDDIMQYVLQLQYTKQCIEETMRLYPPGFIMDRISIAQDEFNGKKIAKNTLLLLSIYEVHKHPDFWESPEKFNPERFNTENKKDYSNQYYPFGAGPRMCVGNNFAMYEMILTIAEIVKKYKITTPLEKIEINPLITLKPKEVLLNFTER